VERDSYAEIAKQMLDGGAMDVVMGAGNPDFDNNGRPVRGEKEYKYVGGADRWQAIEAARAKADGTYQGFRPVSTKAEFEALASGATPAKVLGTVQVGTTLQEARTGEGTENPSQDTPPNAGLPDLATMSRAAINVLAKNPKGFYLMIEGGAVDWANHKNHAGRMIQEQADFVKAVEAVAEWVEANSSWKDTLVILTADHETGLIWGPRSDTEPFDPIVDNGPGKTPGLKYNAKSHSNSLVPVFARGAGSELLAGVVAGKDPVRGVYVDNTGLSQVMFRAATGAKGPAVKPGARDRRPVRRRPAAASAER
jgi:alkaline phosphatase